MTNIEHAIFDFMLNAELAFCFSGKNIKQKNSFIKSYIEKNNDKNNIDKPIYKFICTKLKHKNPSCFYLWVVCYARVSTYDQKQDLVYQSDRLLQWCQEHQLSEPTLITDLGSGLNYKKKGLRQLFRQIALGQFSHLVITHKDRLLRFGSELLFDLCALNNIKISIINDENQVVSREQELAQDVLMLMTVFTAKLHGHRSHQNKRKTQEIMQQAS